MSKYIPNFRTVNGKSVRGEKASNSVYEKIANTILRTQFTGFEFKFPRLNLHSFIEFGYKSEYYIKIADFILSRKINLWIIDKEEKVGFLGLYHNTNNFLFTAKVIQSPWHHLDTIIHEATHAIQDWKRWKQSDLEREMDGHFAAAYFMVLKNKEYLLNSSRYTEYLRIARIIKTNPIHFRTLEFGRDINTLKNAVNSDYMWKFRNDVKMINDFQKRDRWDGI